MAENQPAEGPSAVRLPASPGSRGRLVIADKVVVSVARLAAKEVPGTVSEQGSGLTRKGVPQAHARVAGDRVRIRVDINVEWPFPLVRVASDVRSLVATRVRQLTGLTVDSVDVTVTEVVAPTEIVGLRSPA